MRTPVIGDLVSPPLRLHGAADASRRQVRSVHVSDLEHPGRYLLPGELVLTNGLWVGRAAPRDWIAEIAASGAVAVGFGLGTPHESLPDGLRDACAEHDLPLLEIPESVSFATVQDDLARRLERDTQAALRRHLGRTRELLLGLAGGGGHQALVDVVHRDTELGAALVGAGGRVLAAAGLAPAEEVACAAARAARRCEVPCDVGGDASAFGTAHAGLPGPTLVLGAPLASVPDEVRVVVNQVVLHAALVASRGRASREVRGGLARELVDLARSGDLGEAGLAIRLRGLELDPDTPLTVVASANEPDDVAYAVEGAALDSALTHHDGLTIALLSTASEEDDPLTRLSELIAEAGHEPVLGAGRPGTGPSGLRRSLREALTALTLARARPDGARVVAHLDVGSHVLLLDLVERDVLEVFRETLLGPLERWDADHGTDLMATLRAFLQHDGAWRATAAHLHVHHNTLRHRVERIEALTNRRVSRTGDRVDLHLALSIGAAA